MIHSISHTAEWIGKVAKANNNADKILVEKVIRALTLVGGLKSMDIDFIFKGGTALMLLLPEVKRLSIDIDIILHKKPSDIGQQFEKISKSSGFLSVKEQERKTKSKIDKTHYKFFYTPVTNTRAKEEYILLDILFQKKSLWRTLEGCRDQKPIYQNGRVSDESKSAN